MKKKIALLLAAVMTVAAPMTAFANIEVGHGTGSTNTGDGQVGTLYTVHYPTQANVITDKYSSTPNDMTNPFKYLGPAKNIKFSLAVGDSFGNDALMTLRTQNGSVIFYDGSADSEFNINGQKYSYDRGEYTSIGGQNTEGSSNVKTEQKLTFDNLPSGFTTPRTMVYTVANAGLNSCDLDLTTPAATNYAIYDAHGDKLDTITNFPLGTANGLADGDDVTVTGLNVGITVTPNVGTNGVTLQFSVNYDPTDVTVTLASANATNNAAFKSAFINNFMETDVTGVSGVRFVSFGAANAPTRGDFTMNLPILSTNSGDVKILDRVITSQNMTSASADFTLANVSENAGKTYLSATKSTNGRTGLLVPLTNITERAVGVITSGTTVKPSGFVLSLTSGFKFVDKTYTAYLNNNSNVDVTHIGFSADYTKAYFTIAGTITNSGINSIAISDLEIDRIYNGGTVNQKDAVTLYVDKLEANQQIVVTYAADNDDMTASGTFKRTIGTDSKITSDSVSIGEMRNYGVSFNFTNTTNSAAKAYSGEAAVVIPNITLRENVANSWNSHRTTRFSLTDEEGNVLDGVKINSIQFKTVDNLKWPVSSTIFSADSQIGVGSNHTFNRSFFEITDLTHQDIKLGSELQIIMSINVSGNYVGPVYLTVDGNAVVDETEWELNPLQIADIKAPISIDTKSTEVSIGFQTFDTADVKVTEADKNILKANGTVTLSIAEFAESTNYYSLANNVTFNPITLADVKVEDVAKNKQATVFNKVSVNNNSISLNVSKTSTVASTFTVSALKVNINRSVPYGNFDLVVGGTSFIKTYYGNIVTSSTVSSDAIERSANFAVAGVVSPDYIRVITKSVYKSMEMNILLTEDNQIAKVETKEVDMGIAPYINDAGRMMIPLRALSNLFNIDKDNIIWDEPTSTVTIVLGDRIVSFTKDSSIMKVNGVDVPMQDDKGITTAEIHPVYERFFIPVKPLSTAFDVPVRWDAATKTAYLNPTPAQLVDVFGLTVDSTGNVVSK